MRRYFISIRNFLFYYLKKKKLETIEDSEIKLMLSNIHSITLFKR